MNDAGAATREDPRYIIAAGTSKYDYLPADDQRPEVRDSVARIAACFEPLGYHRELIEVSDDPSAGGYLDALDKWLKSDTRTENDILVLYYCGHGISRDDGHFLLARNSEPDRLLRTAIRTEELGKEILEEGSKAAQVLILLDTCHSGRGAFELTAAVADLLKSSGGAVPDLYVIASCAPKEEVRPDAFSQALARVLRNETQQCGGPTLEFLVPQTVFELVQRQIEKNSAKSGVPCPRLQPLAIGGVRGWRVLRNPAYDPASRNGEDLETEQRLKDLREHWIPRVRGVEESFAVGWYFTGRNAVLKEIIAWLGAAQPQHRSWLVTGGPGTGKSAILARLVTLSDPQTRRQIEEAGGLRGVDAASIPEPKCIDVPVHARGKTLDDVVRLIAEQLDLQLTTATTDKPAAPPSTAELARDRAGRTSSLLWPNALNGW